MTHRLSKLLLALAVLVLAGCATHKINWTERVGNFTRDQAILELGPPEKEATLTDGTVVDEWLSRRGRSVIYTGFGGYYGGGGHYYYGGYAPTYAGSLSPDHFLILIFSPEGQLTSWKKLVR